MRVGLAKRVKAERGGAHRQQRPDKAQGVSLDRWGKGTKRWRVIVQGNKISEGQARWDA